MRNDLSAIITLLLFSIALMVVLKIFFPVLIILGVLLFIGYIIIQYKIKKQQEQERQEEEEYESQLFKEQILKKKKENAKIIDVEYIEKEDSHDDSN